jgi:hypothetical protein
MGSIDESNQRTKISRYCPFKLKFMQVVVHNAGYNISTTMSSYFSFVFQKLFPQVLTKVPTF